MNCWQQLIGDALVDEYSNEQIKEFVENGLPLSVVKQYTDYFIVSLPHSQNPQYILRNQRGDKFLVTPTALVDNVVITHATPFKEQKMLSNRDVKKQ